MANHLRRQIREAVATTVTGLATTGARVYQSRIVQLEANELPGLKVFTGNDAVEVVEIGTNPLQERNLTVTVEAVAKAVNDLDDALDQMIKEVEIAIANNNTLGGLVKDIVITGSDVDMNAEAEMPTGKAVLTFNANYYTRAQAPDVSL